MFWPLRGAASGGSGGEQTRERRFSSFSSSSLSSSSSSSALDRSHFFSSSPLSLSPLSLSRLSSPGLHTLPSSCLSSRRTTGLLRPPSASLLVSSSSSPSLFAGEDAEGKEDSTLSSTLRATSAARMEEGRVTAWRSCVSAAGEEREQRERRADRGEDGEKIKKRKKKKKKKKDCPSLEGERRESFSQLLLGGGIGRGGALESHLYGSHVVLFPLRCQHHIHSQSSPSLLSFTPASYSSSCSPTPSFSSEDATRRVLVEHQVSASKGRKEDTSLSVSGGTEDGEKKEKKTAGDSNISERPDEDAVSSCKEERCGGDHRLKPLMLHLEKRSISEGEVERLHDGDNDEVSRPRAISLVSGVHTETSLFVSDTSLSPSSSSRRLLSSLPDHTHQVTTQHVEGELSPSSLLSSFVNSSPFSTDERGGAYIRLYPPSYVSHLNAGGEKLLSPSSTWRHSFGSSVSTSSSSSSSSDFPYTSSSVPSSPSATPSSAKSVRTCRRRVSSVLSSHMDLTGTTTTGTTATTVHRRRSSSSSISSSASCCTSSPLLSYSSASTNYSFSLSVASRRLTHPASLPSHLDEFKGKAPSACIEKRKQDLHSCKSEPCQFFEAVQRSGDESGGGGVQTLEGGEEEREEGKLFEERGDEGETSSSKFYVVRGEGEVGQEGEKIEDKDEDEEEEDEEDTESDDSTSEESEEEEDEEAFLLERRVTSIETRLFIPPCLRERSASSILKERRKLPDGCCVSPCCTLPYFMPPCSSEVGHHQRRLSSSSTFTFLRRRSSRVGGGQEEFQGQSEQVVEFTRRQETDDGSKQKQEVLDGQDNKVASVHTLRRYGSESFLPALLGVSRFLQASSGFVGDEFRTSEDREDRQKERDVEVVGFGPLKPDLKNPLTFLSRLKRFHQPGNRTGKKEENEQEKRQETKEHSSTDRALRSSSRPSESPANAVREIKGENQQVSDEEGELSRSVELSRRSLLMITRKEKEKHNTKEEDRRSIHAGEREAEQGFNRAITLPTSHSTFGIFSRRDGERVGRRFSSIESATRVSSAQSNSNTEEEVEVSSSGSPGSRSSSSSQFYWSLSLLRRVKKMDHATLVLP